MKFKLLSILMLLAAVLFTGNFDTEVADFDQPTIEQVVSQEAQIDAPAATIDQNIQHSAFSQVSLPADNDRQLFVIANIEENAVYDFSLDRLYLPRSNLRHYTDYYA